MGQLADSWAAFPLLVYILSKSYQSTPTMPGHIKLVKGQADPDPTEFLVPSLEMKRADQSKPYDTRKSVWIPDPKDGGYREGLLESGDLEDPASKCLVVVGHEKFTHSGSIGAVKKDIEDVELAILKVEQDKGNRDHTIKNLQS